MDNKIVKQGIVVLVVVIAALWISSVVFPPTFAAVSGVVTLHGLATKPERVDFNNAQNPSATPSSATVYDNGTYSISLQKGITYKITAHFSALYGLTGSQADCGTLDLTHSSDSVLRDIKC